MSHSIPEVPNEGLVRIRRAPVPAAVTRRSGTAASVSISLVGPESLILNVSGSLNATTLDGAANRLHRLLRMDFRSVVIDARDARDVDDAGRRLLHDVTALGRARGNHVVVIDPAVEEPVVRASAS